MCFFFHLKFWHVLFFHLLPQDTFLLEVDLWSVSIFSVYRILLSHVNGLH